MRNNNITNRVSALDLLQKLYPGQIRLTTGQAAIAIGYSAGSGRTMRCRGTFPIPLAGDGHGYDIRDVAAYLDSARTSKPRRGAPTKAERLAKLEGGAA